MYPYLFIDIVVKKSYQWTQIVTIFVNYVAVHGSDKKVPVKLKNKLYKTVIRLTLIYGSECWALHRAEQQRMHTTEMKMLRWIQGKTRKDRIRNEKFRSDAMVKPITTYVAQKRLSWYGHVMRREDTKFAKQVTTMKVGGKRPRGRPRLRWMDSAELSETTPARPRARTEPRSMETGNHGDRPRTGIRSAEVSREVSEKQQLADLLDRSTKPDPCR